MVPGRRHLVSAVDRVRARPVRSGGAGEQSQPGVRHDRAAARGHRTRIWVGAGILHLGSAFHRNGQDSRQALSLQVEGTFACLGRADTYPRRIAEVSVTAMTVIDAAPSTTSAVPDGCLASAGPHPRPDGQDRYTIREVSAHTGLRSHTLRWYEQIGLMPQVDRTANGQRVFSNHDLDWLAFVGTLRLTGMTVAAMVRFAELVREGGSGTDSTERQEILQRARREAVARIATLRQAVATIDAKIHFYAASPEGADASS